ncbi:exosortase-associated EpsI family protein [Prosthecobacter sp.]|uniref:exosortase-associated EpsI family protein n=1 Tax=Prosthecobacter sp. TaxID=1965333 RepID=UPI001D84BD2B|nr:exosortase-associated EpsI family protein [Prosthecobacter sp.]MCB1275851.1 exosortase-associated EpsI family protein [Prosthecobacter sp.]
MIIRAVILLALCGMTMLLCQFSPQPKGGDEIGIRADLPMVAGSFVGESEAPSEKELALLPGDTIIVKREYRTPGRPLDKRDLAHASLVIAGNDSRSIHRPEVCLDGQGWTITDSRVREIKLLSGELLHVRDLAIEREVLLNDGSKLPLRAHYVYWFVGADVSTPSNLERQLISLRDSVLRNVNHRWAYPSVMARVTDNLTPQQSGERSRNDEDTVKMILSLIRSLAPHLQKGEMPHS